MTDKLFYADSHKREFEAEVLSCAKDSDCYKIVLDQTAFFPEGGGQYADTGYINDVKITDAHEKDGVIYHTADAPLEPGTRVAGRINWGERFDRMQQHTGEHIISGLVHQRYGYDNVGFHLGGDYCTMDFNGPVPKDHLKEIEIEANRAVYHDLDVQVTYPSREELSEMVYRSKIEIEGQVRIVTVPGYDVCACCAPHVKRTGEIGNIKLVDMIHYKGGVRITMLCGMRALKDYNIKEENVKRISALLCAKESAVSEAVAQLKEEKAQLKSKAVSFQQQILAYRAKEISTDKKITAVFDAGLEGNGPRELMNLLLNRGAEICAVFAGADGDGYRYVIGSKTEDVRPLCKKLNEAFAGRGGGKPEMAQGSLTGARESVESFLGQFYQV